MSSPPTLPILLLTTFVILHSSFDIAAAPPPELTVLRAQYEKIVAERVSAPFDTALTELNTKFTTALDNAATAAKQAGKLDDVLGIQDDKKRLAEKLPIPDETAETSETLKKLRAIYRGQLTKLEEARTANHQSLLPAYTAKLQELEITLTKADRIDEAKELKTYRTELSAGSVAPASAPASTASSPASSSAPSVSKVKGDDRKAAEWVLANWSDFRLFVDDHRPVSKPADLPKGKFAIESLAMDGRFFTGGTLTGEALQVLAGLAELKTFTFGKFPDLKDADLSFLSSLSALEELNLNNLGATDALIPFLSKHRHLSKLALSEIAGITGMTMDQLTATKLTWLQVWKSGLTDEGVGKIATLPGITHLDIQTHDKVTNGSIPHLRTMRQLNSLMISSTEITPEGFGGVTMTKITRLSGNALAGLSLSELAPKLAPIFPNITAFSLSYFANSPEDMAALAHFKKLETLSNYGTIKEAAWPGILELRELRVFQGGVSGVSDANLNFLSQLKKLKFISLGAKSPSDAALAAFKKARPDVKVEK